MKRFVSLSVVLLSAALLVSACSKDDSPTTPPTASLKASDYWPPTAANSALTLEGSVKVSTNGVVVSETPMKSTMISKGGTATTADGKTVVPYMGIDVNESGTDTTLFWAYLSDQVVLNYHSLAAGPDIDTVLRAPIAVGTTWGAANSDRGSYTIVALNETVVTPAGTFQNCIKMRNVMSDPASGAALQNDLWLAKGIGPVKMSGETNTSIGGVSMKIETLILLKSKTF